ncbi:DNA polymerase subunit gamma-2, mitochondrial [Thrips palmi]|uniref:DNA polymerase subunit gamma-2, mitochondrial n=1 Tax=Thrips palmi TaxID=161013 RepID=A0A6P8Z5R7_THRPL|nr:DNA polymerase subunit gamma-2, mitochondrial [Thrips palmi]
MMAMKKVLNLCDKHGFVKPVWKGAEVSSLKFGPIGEFLVNNVRQEWYLGNVIDRNDNVFPIHSHASQLSGLGIEEPFCQIKSLCQGVLPFGIAQTICDGTLIHKQINDTTPPHAAFNPSHRTCLRSLLFVSPTDGRQKFYTWQQKRKMWWRKFSSHPGRFSLSDIIETRSEDKNVDGNDLRVNILAEFDWGPTIVETVHLSSLSSSQLSNEQLEALKVKQGHKHVLPDVVECILSLEVASLAFLCDAFSESSKRLLLRLHRRLAPLKVGFVVNLSDSSVSDRLLEVAKHLSLSLRQKAVSTLMLPDIIKKSQDLQINRNDEMGIPFTIILSDSTLNDGIIHLYSRETTLKEQVHISKVPDYVKLLVKNF